MAFPDRRNAMHRLVILAEKIANESVETDHWLVPDFLNPRSDFWKSNIWNKKEQYKLIRPQQ